jgi:hypothetical protein
MENKFKPGDTVAYKNGDLFTTGNHMAVVDNVKGDRVWFTHGFWAYDHELMHPESSVPQVTADAPDSLLYAAADLISSRGKERDKAGGERSMARCVNTFNAMTGRDLSEEEGWLFMVYLKHARMQGGAFKRDDYEDAIAYTALQAECAIKEDARVKSD